VQVMIGMSSMASYPEENPPVLTFAVLLLDGVAAVDTIRIVNLANDTRVAVCVTDRWEFTSRTAMDTGAKGIV
jgi:hypothetical protein